MSGARKASEAPLPGGDFRLFTTRIAFQAMMSLGILENPVTGSRQVNLDSARMLIDDLKMLREKTRGNLDEGELAQLEKSVRDLEHAYTRLAQQGAHEA